MNKPAVPKRYKLLVTLRDNGAALKTKKIAELLGVTQVTVWEHIGQLTKEGLVARKGKHFETVTVTLAGFLWEEPKKEMVQEVPRRPCGHPIVESTPDFCLKCRNAGRWDALDGNVRYYMPTMSQAAGR